MSYLSVFRIFCLFYIPIGHVILILLLIYFYPYIVFFFFMFFVICSERDTVKKYRFYCFLTTNRTRLYTMWLLVELCVLTMMLLFLVYDQNFKCPHTMYQYT